jgi:CBS domain containing-hemolysin-like protein
MTLLLIYLGIAVGVSFLCSVLEAVLLSVTPSYVADLELRRPRGGKVLAQVKERLDESISSILILNTFAHTMGAAGVGAQAIRLFGERWETLIAVVLTLVILYVSEIIPKTLGAKFWRTLAIPAAYVIHWLVRLVYPLVWLSTRLTRVFGHDKHGGVSREEIIALASLGYKGGTLLNREHEILANIMRLREIRTEQILTPRSVVYALPQTTTVAAALEQHKTEEFTRIPIYRDSLDHIVGMVINRDLYKADRAGEGEQPLTRYATPLHRVSEKLPVQKLLDVFVTRGEHLFLVEDEFGQTAGIVSLEDAIETLLGREIVDESDTVTDLQQLAKQRYRQRLRNNRDDISGARP